MKKIITVTVVLIISVWLTGCKEKNDQSQSPKKPTPAVRAAQAITGMISKELELTGSVIATRIAKMGSPAEGPVMNCEIREGDAVQKNQVLLKIGRRKAADALVEAARESLSRENEELRRIEQLVKSGAIAAEELDMARLRVSRANAELSKAIESAGDYEIKAPWDGLVSKVYVTDGYFVAPREPLVEIYAPLSMVVQFFVPEAQAAHIEKGMPVMVRFDVYPDRELKAVVSRTYPHVNPQTRTRTVEAELVKGNDISLLPGMFTRVRLVLDTVDNAVLVPEKALLVTPSDEHIVFVVKNNKASLRKVKLGYEQSYNIQIVEGLEAGEQVVVEGNENLKDGMEIKLIRGQGNR
jgi:membrane fusion protein (multidrug efflux system)